MHFDRITSSDFDLQRAGRNAGVLFGPGLYFAESSLKADSSIRIKTAEFQGSRVGFDD